jgi:high affinity sulfate transporter 1
MVFAGQRSGLSQRKDMNSQIKPSWTELRFDVIAGLTAAAVVLPKAMAYATVAGLPAGVGLYTALVPMVIYALLGTSRVLSVSSTATLAILTSTQLALVVPDGNPDQLITAAATLAALTGTLLIVASVLRFGFIANFISSPVLTGFKAGIGLVVILDQAPKLFGIHIVKRDFFRDLFSILLHLPDTSWVTLLIAVLTMLLLVGMKKWRPHSPAPLVVVAGGIAASALFGLNAMGVATVGLIPRGLPSPTLPDLDLLQQLLPGACGIALMSFTESIAAGRAFSAVCDPPINANREILAIGAANLGGAFLGAMPAGGGTTQTAVVRAVGGRTQKASLITAAAAAGTMLVLASVLGLLPQAVLAGVVIIYSIGLIQPAEFAAIHKVRNMEFHWALAAFAGVLLFGTLSGIVVAIILSMIGLSSQSTHPNVYVIGRKRGEDVLRPLSETHPDDETFPGLLILRPEGRLFFVNARQVGDHIQALIATYQPRVLALDMSRVIDIEYSALQMMIEGERRLTAAGTIVWLADLSPSVRACIHASGFDTHLGHERLFPNARAVIRHYQEQLANATSLPVSTEGALRS